MDDTIVRRKLVEGIVKLVDELIDYKAEVTIRGFVKVTADKQNVLPVTLREQVKRKKEESVTVEEETKLKHKPAKGKRKTSKATEDSETTFAKDVTPSESLTSQEKGNAAVVLPEEEVLTKEMTSEKQAEGSICDLTEENLACSNPRKRPATRHSPRTRLKKRKTRTNSDDQENHGVIESTISFDLDEKADCEGSVKKEDTMADEITTTAEVYFNSDSDETPVSSTQNSFPCVMCKSKNMDIMLDSASKLFAHGRTTHSQGEYKCEECGQKYSSYFKLHNHSYLVHSEVRNFSCQECSKHFVWEVNWKRHMKEHKPTPFRCMKCPWPGRTFQNYSTYVYHRKTDHTRENVPLRRRNVLSELLVGKTVNEVTRGNLPKPKLGLSKADTEMIFVTTSNRKGRERKAVHKCLKCPHCDMVYWHPASLRNHIHGQHSQDNYTCPVCGISVKHASSMTRHLKSHNTQERCFRCDQCDKTYRRNCELLRHKKAKHSNAGRRFVCSLCGNKFHTNWDLKVHEERHAKTGKAVLHRGRFPPRKGEIFCCGECSKVFQRENLLKAHISVTHNNERNYGCGVCGKFYGRSCHLRRHQLVAHGIKAKETVLIKEEKEAEPTATFVQVDPESQAVSFEGAEELIADGEEYMILADDSTVQTIVIEPSEDGQVTEELVEQEYEEIMLHQCPMCEAMFTNEEDIQVHLTQDHNAIILLETEEQVKTEEWVPTS